MLNSERGPDQSMFVRKRSTKLGSVDGNTTFHVLKLMTVVMLSNKMLNDGHTFFPPWAPSFTPLSHFLPMLSPPIDPG